MTPAGYADSMNLYGLGAGSPIRFLDPFGLDGDDYYDDEYWHPTLGNDGLRLFEDEPLRSYGEELYRSAQWGEPIMFGFGLLLLTPAMILTPGPEDLIFAATIWGTVRVGGVLYNVIKTVGGYRLVRAGARLLRPLAAPFVRVFGGKAALAIGVRIDDIAAVELRRLVRTNGFSLKWPNFRFEWHRLPNRLTLPKWARGKNLPHWHRRGPGGIQRHRPWEYGRGCRF